MYSRKTSMIRLINRLIERTVSLVSARRAPPMGPMQTMLTSPLGQAGIRPLPVLGAKPLAGTQDRRGAMSAALSTPDDDQPVDLTTPTTCADADAGASSATYTCLFNDPGTDYRELTDEPRSEGKRALCEEWHVSAYEGIVGSYPVVADPCDLRTIQDPDVKTPVSGNR